LGGGGGERLDFEKKANKGKAVLAKKVPHPKRKKSSYSLTGEILKGGGNEQRGPSSGKRPVIFQDGDLLILQNWGEERNSSRERKRMTKKRPESLPPKRIAGKSKNTFTSPKTLSLGTDRERMSERNTFFLPARNKRASKGFIFL